MKKVLLGGVALITLGFVGAAVAADMPLKAPPPVVVNTWTGFYVGVDFGGISGSNGSKSFSQSPGLGALPASAVTFDPVVLNTSNHWGGQGGVYAGYNWAVSPSWVIGIEGDWSKTNLGTTAVDPTLTFLGIPVPAGCTAVAFGAPSTCSGVMMSDNLNWIASVRGRLGYTWGSMMLYGTAGGAWMNEELSGQVLNCTNATAACTGSNLGNNRAASIAFSQNATNTGWVAGGGIELMATANWLVRVEYLHYAFGSGATHSAACTQCLAGTFSGPGNFTWGSTSYNTVRAGLAYKF